MEVILAVNSGSASRKYALYEKGELRAYAWYEIVGEGYQCTTVVGQSKKLFPIEKQIYDQSSSEVLKFFRDAQVLAQNPDVVGFRVVHGGKYRAPEKITDELISYLDSLDGLAPLHNKPALQEIREFRTLLSGVPAVAVFDTGFHSTLPDYAKSYAIPYDMAEKNDLHRMGFHGTSCASIIYQLSGRASGVPEKLIVCHLGGGASVTAIKAGKSIDTSMGLTPLEGLMMATRGGDMDPGIILELQRLTKKNSSEMIDFLNNECGLLGLGGHKDMRKIIERDRAGDSRARLALNLFTYRVKKYIGAYSAALGGLNMIVFTATMGENAPYIREKICAGLEYLGVVLESERNKATRDGATGVISADTSPVRVEVLHTDELFEIARESGKMSLGVEW